MRSAADASILPQLLAARDTTADEDGDHGHLGLETYQLEDAEWLKAAGRNLQNIACYEWEDGEYDYDTNYVRVPCDNLPPSVAAYDYSYSPSVSESQSGFAPEGGGRPSSNGDGDSGLAGGVIAAIVLGSLLCCCLPCVVGGVFLCCRTRRKKQQHGASQDPAQPGKLGQPCNVAPGVPIRVAAGPPPPGFESSKPGTGPPPPPPLHGPPQAAPAPPAAAGVYPPPAPLPGAAPPTTDAALAPQV